MDNQNNQNNKNDNEKDKVVCRKCNRQLYKEWGEYCFYCGTKNEIVYDNLTNLTYELGLEELNVWLEISGAKLHLTLSKEELKAYEKEITELTEKLRQFYQNEDYVERGIEG